MPVGAVLTQPTTISTAILRRCKWTSTRKGFHTRIFWIFFWNSHDPGQKPWSRQYASIIFFHDDEQKRLAEESKSRQEEALGKAILYTDILPYSSFHLAEDYHQKYWLQGSSKLINEFRVFYPNFKGIISSTAAARVNGIIGGYGRLNGTVKELSSYGLSAESNKLLMALLNRSARQPVSSSD